MSLTISITKMGIHQPCDENNSVEFSGEDGYWEFLYPWIKEFNEQTSEAIDLYNYYDLDRKNLPILLETLSQTRLNIERGPEEIDVYMGTETYMGKSTEVHKMIARHEILVFVDKFISLIRNAIDSGETLANLGD